MGKGKHDLITSQDWKYLPVTEISEAESDLLEAKDAGDVSVLRSGMNI